jgi:hypothetical protein
LGGAVKFDFRTGPVALMMPEFLRHPIRFILTGSISSGMLVSEDPGSRRLPTQCMLVLGNEKSPGARPGLFT